MIQVVLPLLLRAAVTAYSLSPIQSVEPDRPGLPRDLWMDASQELLGETGQWTNHVEVADLDGDGLVDILFANGGDYSKVGELEMNRAFFNEGPGKSFRERSADVFGESPDTARVIKVRDVNGDGLVDVMVGTTFQTQSRLFFGLGDGKFEERTKTHLPQLALSIGDLEFGDVDADGDLDLVLTDWGPGNNMSNAGGRTLLWLNDGGGHFQDVTEDRMPETLVQFSWDLEFVDFDNDFDLDVVVSCKRGAGSKLLRNDGSGKFADMSRLLPFYTNNYEFEVMDLNGDGFLDLVTLNDGDIVGGRSSSRREHVFKNDRGRYFRDMTSTWWPASENVGEDDNMVAFLDYDSDGDADFLIGSLTGADRLLINDGSGTLRMADAVVNGEATPGTLAIALADLNGDDRLDLVQAQGEHRTAIQERVHLGTGLAADTAAPTLGTAHLSGDAAKGFRLRVRVHDHKSPSMPQDWRSVTAHWTAEHGAGHLDLSWYGEYLWTAQLPPGLGKGVLRVEAVDAAGNLARGTDVPLEATPAPPRRGRPGR